MHVVDEPGDRVPVPAGWEPVEFCQHGGGVTGMTGGDVPGVRERPGAPEQVIEPTDVLEALRFRDVLSIQELSDRCPPDWGQFAATGEPIQYVGESHLASGGRPPLGEDVHGPLAFRRFRAPQSMQQHQGALALPQVAADLLAVLLWFCPQVQQVVGDLERCAQVAAEGL